MNFNFPELFHQVRTKPFKWFLVFGAEKMTENFIEGKVMETMSIVGIRGSI